MASRWGVVRERTAITQKRHPTEVLERILNKTTLSTKKLTHDHILDIGQVVSLKVQNNFEEEKQKAVHDAVAEAWKEADKLKQKELSRLSRRLRREQEAALESQSQYYENLARATAKERDARERQTIADLKRRMKDDKEAALKEQWEKAIVMKRKAVFEACEELRKKLTNEFEVAKFNAIKEALRKAREAFDLELAEALARQKADSDAEMLRRLEEQEKRYQAEVKRLNEKYDKLTKIWKAEIAHRELVESDFKDLQLEFQRFMDYSDGQYSSDCMLSLKKHGLQLAKKPITSYVKEIVDQVSP